MIQYNTLVVLLGASMLGASAGAAGCYAVLRGRALTGDALAHAALPGLCLAFLFVGEKNVVYMLLGALLAGLLGVAIVTLLRRYTRIKEDAGLGIVLSVFFGAGIVLSSIIQNHSASASKAGLDSYILGKTAGMTAQDVYWIGGIALVCFAAIMALSKEFRLVSFDPAFARVQGWPVLVLDLSLMTLIAVTVVIGLPAVGVVMTAALLILPGAAARFWTDRLQHMLILSALFGFITGLVGAGLSAEYRSLPAGPVIVLVGAGILVVSMLFAPRRGAFARLIVERNHRRDVAQRNLLGEVFECLESDRHPDSPFSTDEIASRQGWSVGKTGAELGTLARSGHVERVADGRWELTERGLRRAAETTRSRRLWEMFFCDHAELLPVYAGHRDEPPADVLSNETVAELGRRLQSAGRDPCARAASTRFAKETA